MAETAVAGTKSLKDANANTLFLVLAGNVAAFFVARNTGLFDFFTWGKLVAAVISAWPAGLGAALAGIVNSQVSDDVKAKLVFLRWNHPLPGSRAFTVLGPRDPRVNMIELKRRFAPLPTDPRTQNTVWYNLLHLVEDQPSIADLHRQYLFTRDYTFLALVMLIVLGGVAAFIIRPPEAAAIYIGIMAAQLVLAMRAAQDRGNRLVTTVLARNATTPGG